MYIYVKLYISFDAIISIVYYCGSNLLHSFIIIYTTTITWLILMLINLPLSHWYHPVISFVHFIHTMLQIEKKLQQQQILCFEITKIKMVTK